MKKTIGILAVLIALVLLGGPYYGGLKAEQELQELAAALNSYPGYTASWEAYERGWFGTEAVLVVGLDPSYLTAASEVNLPESFDVPLNANIKHGPLLFSEVATLGWFAWQVQLGGAPATWLAEHVTPSEEGPLYHGEGYMGLNGAVDFSDAVQAFTVAGEDGVNLLTSAGYVGAGKIDSGRQLSYQGMIRQTDFSAQDLLIAVGNTNITLDGDLSQLDWETLLYPSNFLLHTTSLKAESGEQHLELVNFGVEGVIEMPQEADWFTTVVTLSLGSLATNEISVTNASTTLAYERVSLAAYKAYVDAVSQYATGQDPAADFTQFFTPELIQQFASNSPAVALRNLNFSMPAGDLLANFNLRLEADPAMAAQMSNPLFLLQALKFDAFLELDRTLAKYFAQRTARAQLEGAQAGGEAPDVDLAAQSEQQAEQMLQMLTAQNFLVEEGEDLQATVQFANGQLLLNGNPMPIPLGALLGGQQQPPAAQIPGQSPPGQSPQAPQVPAQP